MNSLAHTALITLLSDAPMGSSDNVVSVGIEVALAPLECEYILPSGVLVDHH